jgi:glucose-6-phosphate dehydrogenase assembly protein OpcA
MPTAYKILGQSNPGASTETTLYTVPSSTSAVVSSIAVCNQTASSATFRIAVQPSADTGSNAAAKHFLVHGTTVGASDTVVLTIGVTLATGDRIRVIGSVANLSFSAFGSEIS